MPSLLEIRLIAFLQRDWATSGLNRVHGIPARVETGVKPGVTAATMPPDRRAQLPRNIGE
jgi:hypothetical protein